MTQQPDIPHTPRYAQLWSDISHDFNGIRRQKSIEGSIDGHPRLFMTPGDAIQFNVLSKRWNKWLGILEIEAMVDVEALAFLAATNQASIELRLGMAWKMLLAIGTVIALQKLEVGVLLGQAVRDLASYGTIGQVMIAVLWIGFVTIATYMLLIHLWRINASELRACVDLALLRRKSAAQPVHA
ncbi:hypothetical protein ASG67_17475 [Sphingomonas sp. Leaf339]|nr:hypothetical protein ASG67_17475 [Sphingomonas sp. Leaf339]